VVRIGSVAKVSPELRHLSLEALSEGTPAGKVAVAQRNAARLELEQIREQLRSGGDMEEVVRRRLGSEESQAKARIAAAGQQLKECMREILDRAQVICSTCTGAGDPVLTGRLFKAVVIDEATQATEPAVLIPLTRGAQWVVMAGDPKQLPPTVVSAEALNRGLNITLFERIQVWRCGDVLVKANGL
jgi:hypothetical protein